MKNLVDVNSQDLKPGVIYLTHGSAEQIQWLFKDRKSKFTCLCEPTTDEFIRTVSCLDSSLRYEGYQNEVVIVHPKTLGGTLKKRKSKKEKENPEDEGAYKLPNDGEVSLHRLCYVFVICSNMIGELEKTTKNKEIKSLLGPQYVFLDLSQINYGELEKHPWIDQYRFFPLSLEEKISYQCLKDFDNEETNIQEEQDLILSLKTLKGVERWSNFSESEVYKLFLIENYKRVPLLCAARAWCLEVYLKPFLDRVKKDNPISHPTAVLGDFAYWVYCASNHWSTANSKGLELYLSRSSPPLPTFSFYISKRAKYEWLKLTSDLPKRP